MRALGFVGTEFSLGTLVEMARQGHNGALWALGKLLTNFPKFAPQAFVLAEDSLLSENAQVREQAVGIIVKLRKVKEAEAALVKSVETFADEFTLSALREASITILPRLEKLKNRFKPEGAEYQDIERTIHALEEKQQTLIAEAA